jgi:hypothetical protein
MHDWVDWDEGEWYRNHCGDVSLFSVDLGSSFMLDQSLFCRVSYRDRPQQSIQPDYITE